MCPSENDLFTWVDAPWVQWCTCTTPFQPCHGSSSQELKSQKAFLYLAFWATQMLNLVSTSSRWALLSLPLLLLPATARAYAVLGLGLAPAHSSWAARGLYCAWDCGSKQAHCPSLPAPYQSQSECREEECAHLPLLSQIQMSSASAQHSRSETSVPLILVSLRCRH